jgi:hypothetical protein
MSGRPGLTPIGIGIVVIAVPAVLAFIFGSTGVQIAGLVVLLLEVAFIAVRPGFGPGLDGGWLALKTQGRAVPGTGPEVPDPKPDYIPEAGTPSEETWAHERELYRKKDATDA